MNQKPDNDNLTLNRKSYPKGILKNTTQNTTLLQTAKNYLTGVVRLLVTTKKLPELIHCKYKRNCSTGTVKAHAMSLMAQSYYMSEGLAEFRKTILLDDNCITVKNIKGIYYSKK